MKKNLTLTLSLVVLAFAALFTSSCDKSKTVVFDIEYTVSDFTVGPLTYGGPEDTILSVTYPSDLVAELAANGVSFEDIDKVVLKDMTFTALNGGNFDNLFYADSWLRAYPLDDIQVGFISADSLANVSSNTVFSLTPEFADLSEHLSQPFFELYVKSYAKPQTTFPATDVSATFVVEVTATK